MLEIAILGSFLLKSARTVLPKKRVFPKAETYQKPLSFVTLRIQQHPLPKSDTCHSLTRQAASSSTQHRRCFPPRHQRRKPSEFEITHEKKNFAKLPAFWITVYCAAIPISYLPVLHPSRTNLVKSQEATKCHTHLPLTPILTYPIPPLSSQ